MNELHVVFGAGQVGSLLARELLAKGKQVRQVRQRAVGPARAGLEVLAGDVADLGFAAQAAKGAAVLYDCLNPQYWEWPQKLPPLRRGVLHAARTSGARLVQLDNLYMYGASATPFTEDSPIRPCSKKGELRARLAQEVLDASARGEVRVAIARASDFFGPGFGNNAVFSERYFQRVLAGKAGEAVGDPELPHSYSYGPDVVQGLITLGEHEDAAGQVWHLPVAAAEPTRAWMERMAQALEVPFRLTRVPQWVLQAMGLFSPVMREVAEMTYQWRSPFVLDDARFRARFGATPTAPEVALAETARWARATYGEPRRHRAA